MKKNILKITFVSFTICTLLLLFSISAYAETVVNLYPSENDTYTKELDAKKARQNKRKELELDEPEYTLVKGKAIKNEEVTSDSERIEVSRTLEFPLTYKVGSEELFGKNVESSEAKTMLLVGKNLITDDGVKNIENVAVVLQLINENKKINLELQKKEKNKPEEERNELYVANYVKLSNYELRVFAEEICKNKNISMKYVANIVKNAYIQKFPSYMQ